MSGNHSGRIRAVWCRHDGVPASGHLIVDRQRVTFQESYRGKTWSHPLSAVVRVSTYRPLWWQLLLFETGFRRRIVFELASGQKEVIIVDFLKRTLRRLADMGLDVPQDHPRSDG